MEVLKYARLLSIVFLIKRSDGYQQGTLSILMNMLDDYMPKPSANQEQTSLNLDQEYDFIIVGSGSAGSVLANRLSEVSEWKILLLEAGRPANILNQVPVLCPVYQATNYNWNYKMEEQDNVCLAMKENRCNWPKGKALGGTTVLNYMIYTRGNPLDYKRWSENNSGWSYEEVLKYYLKSENCNLGPEICSGPYHSRNGLLSTEYPFTSVLTDAFLNAGVELGNNITDYNSLNYMGFSKIQANLKFGRRHSVAEAYLKPVKNRPNLHILISARVIKILINPQSKEAEGVVLLKNKKQFTVRAKKEVILSAGTFHSPQLLMLSGVGPKNDLLDVGIDPIHDLPVGKTMYDHTVFMGLTFKINQTIEPREKLFDPTELFQFLLQGKGVLTSLGGIEALGYIKTEASTDIDNYPDVELIFSAAGNMEIDYGIVSVPTLGIRREVYDKVWKPLESTPCWTILPMPLHPKSVGYVKLRSKDPFDAPLLYGNYFTDQEGHDIKTFLAAIRYIIKLSKTTAFKKFGSELYETPILGCESFKFNSDDYWKCALKQVTTTVHHQIGTCKMGPRSDPSAVVDNRLKVHGLARLRVVDASIMPTTLSAHTSAPSMMIGEKAADMIKEEHFQGQPT